MHNAHLKVDEGHRENIETYETNVKEGSFRKSPEIIFLNYQLYIY